MRDDLPLRLEQLRELGFGAVETWGESAPGEPFYLYTTDGEGLSIDVGVLDEVDGHPVVDVGRLFFLVGGEETPSGFRVHLPADAFAHPMATVDGVPTCPLTPLALYQIRIGIAAGGAFGELDDKQRRSLRRLRETFFAEVGEGELAPLVEPIPDR